ncbi:MmgE/PrpD family protein [Micromonospora cremea]|uniref:2-methylcitrate dehydratase PrpD n=1 Tax=Micromonospora cremea TaxID=709881 RepID=A0A1N5VKB8_9ACTN|nr:MmgE/PrpD family protein [Micromonospora cremea]SIM72685.1 2-methylcitrate dehydratase PrpD [Micromonospora cremea]
MGGVTDRLAEFVAANAGRSFGGDHAVATKAVVLDSVGVIAAGAGSEAGHAALRYARSASVGCSAGLRWWGGPVDVPPSVAAMCTGTLAHALDFDDALPGAGHPSALLLSALLADQRTPVSGVALVSAFIVGYEVNARLAKAVGHRHYLHGWHTTATIGSFGATAAVCALLGLDEPTVRTAFGIAGSLTGGLQRNFGTMTKPLHSGLAASNGVLAARLASNGMTSADAIFDGPRGYLDIYSLGASRLDAFDDLGDRWAISSPGSTVKKYPCALETYRAVEAAVEAREQLGVPATEIAAVECIVPPGTMGPLRYHRPTTELEAKFSMHYTVAAALFDGTLTLDSFTDAAIERPAVRALMELVAVREDVVCRPEDPEGLNSSASSGGFVDVVVRTRDGRSATARVTNVVGSPARPLTEQEQRSKFTDCLRTGGRDTGLVDELLARLRDLDRVDDVDKALTVLTPTNAEEHR